LTQTLGQERQAIAYKDTELAQSGIVNNEATLLTSNAMQKEMIAGIEGKGQGRSSEVKKEVVIPHSKPRTRAMENKKKMKLAQHISVPKTWREKVALAKHNAGLVLNVLEALQGGKLSINPHAHFLSGIPFQILEALGEDRERYQQKSLEAYEHEKGYFKAKALLLSLLDQKDSLSSPTVVKKPVKGDPPVIRQTKASALRAARNSEQGDSSEAETPESMMLKVNKQIEDIKGQITELRARKEKAVVDMSGILGVYCNRANSSRIRGATFSKPFVFNVTKWAKSSLDEPKHYKNKVVEMLKRGEVCVTIFAGSEGFTIAKEPEAIPVFNVDPWDLVENHAESYSLLWGSRVEGLGMGVRQILSLMQQVTQLAGEDAVSKLKLVLSLSATVAGAVIADFVERGFYGLDPESVVFLDQLWFPGFQFDGEKREFAPYTGSNKQSNNSRFPLGTGYTLKLLSWPEAGFTIGPKGERKPIETSVLQYVHERKVDWMCSHQANDLISLTAGKALDADRLALTLMLHKTTNATMSVEVTPLKMEHELRHLGSLMLRDTSKKGSSRFSENVQYDCFQYERELFDKLKKESDGELTGYVGRAIFYVPELIKILKKLDVVGEKAIMDDKFNTPHLSMVEDSNVVKVHYSIENLSSHMNCASIQLDCSLRETYNPFEQVPRDVRELVSAVTRQDGSQAFIEQVSSLPKGNLSTLRMSAHGLKKRFTVMVCCAANLKSRVAFEMVEVFVQRNVDEIILVHFVRSMQEAPQASKLLDSFHTTDVFIECRKEVIIRRREQGWELRDDINEAASDFEVDLIVFGSNSLGAGDERLGSMGHRFLGHGLHFSCLFVNENHVNEDHKEEFWEGHNVGVALTAESTEFIDFVTTFFRAGKDQLYLYRCYKKTLGVNHDTAPEEAERIVSIRKSQILVKANTKCKGKALDGRPRVIFPQVVRKDSLDFLCLPGPSGLDVTKGLVEIYMKSKCALLIHKAKSRDTQLDGIWTHEGL